KYSETERKSEHLLHSIASLYRSDGVQKQLSTQEEAFIQKIAVCLKQQTKALEQLHNKAMQNGDQKRAKLFAGVLQDLRELGIKVAQLMNKLEGERPESLNYRVRNTH